MKRSAWIVGLLLALFGLGVVVAPQGWAAEKAEVSAPAGPVNVNTAGLDELTRLKGVGEATARAIVEYRMINGPFASVDDLIEVKGIGAKRLEAIRGEVTVE